MQRAGHDQALDNADRFCPQISPTEYPIFAAHQDNPQGVQGGSGQSIHPDRQGTLLILRDALGYTTALPEMGCLVKIQPHRTVSRSRQHCVVICLA